MGLATWSVEDIAVLASAHRADSELLDRHGDQGDVDAIRREREAVIAHLRTQLDKLRTGTSLSGERGRGERQQKEEDARPPASLTPDNKPPRVARNPSSDE